MLAPRRIADLFALALLALLLAGCAPEGAAPPSTSLPGLEPGVWRAVALDGDPRCADGSGYRAWVRPGESDGVLVFFQGGGACWGPVTCGDPLDGADDDSGFYYARIVGAPSGRSGEGILDAGAAANPFADDTVFWLPYCTGDVYAGDARVRYDRVVNDDLTVRHQGARNARAALDWIVREVPEPARVTVSGCSAGAYGASLFTPELRRAWPEASLLQVGDAGVGVITEAFVDGENGLRRWGIEPAFAAALPAFDVAPDELYGTDLLERVYAETLAAFPEITMAQHSTDLDAVQTLFWDLQGGGDPLEVGEYAAWGERAAASLARLEATSDRFGSYLSRWDPNGDRSDGTGHCLLNTDALFGHEGGAVAAWLDDLLAGAAPRVRE